MPSRKAHGFSVLAIWVTFGIGIMSGAEPIKRMFDLPADTADKSLKRFSAQAGVEVLVPTQLAKSVVTRAVKGEMAAKDALDAMLANTGLKVVQDPKTQAFSIRREGDPPNGRKAAQTSGSGRLSGASASPGARNEAGSGTLTGRISNPATGEYVRNAEVRIDGTQIMALSNATGIYRITNLPAGPVKVAVAYTGYRTALADITIVSEQTTTQDFELSPMVDQRSGEVPIQLEGFTVSGEREGSAKAIMEQRQAMNIKHVVASDAFGDLAEGNIAELLKYLPSMEVQYDEAQASSVQIRGLNSKYGAVVVDGVRVANTVAGRGPELETSAANNVDMIEVNKTTSADMDADAPAGTINMRSKSALSRKGRYISWQVNGVVNSRLAKLGKSQGPDDSLHHNTRFGGVLDFSDTYLGEKLGLVATFAVSNWYSEQYYIQHAYNYTPTAESPAPVVLTGITYKDGPQTQLRYNGGLNFEWKPFDHLSVALRTQYSFFDKRFHNRTVGLVSARANLLPGSDTTEMITNQVATNANRMTLGGTSSERTFENNNVSLRVEYTRGEWEFDGVATYSRGFSEAGSLGQENGPLFASSLSLFPISWRATRSDARSTAWQFEQTSGPDFYNLANWARVPASNNMQAFFSSRDKRQYTVLANAKWTARWRLPTFLKGGVKVQEMTYKDTSLTYMYTFVGPSGVQTQAEIPISRFQYDPEMGGNLFTDRTFQLPDRGALGGLLRQHPEYFVDAPTNSTSDASRFPDRYVKEQVNAAYAMANTRLGGLMLQGGVRYEETRTMGKTYEREVGRHRGTKYDDIFLSGAAKYRFTKDLIATVSVSQGILRPDLANLTGRATFNDETMTGTVPNAELKPEHSNNYSAQLEYYFEPVGLLSAGFFLNEMKDVQVQTRDIPAEDLGLGSDYPGFLFTTFRNASELRIKGFELSYSQQLTFLPGALRGLGVFANFTRNIPSTRDWAATLAPYLASGGVSFSHRGLAMSVKGTWTDDTFWSTGASFVRYRYERTLIDVSASYRIGRRTTLFVSGRNVFDEPIAWYENERSRLWYLQRFGTNWTFGIKGAF